MDEKLVAVGEHLIEQVIEVGINGRGRMKGAVPVAEEHLLATGGNREEAVRRLVATHVRLAAASGFVTGLGGFVALPVTLPVGLGGLYILATRMCAGIAHLRGYDVHAEEVRSAIIVSLLGSAGAATLKRAGVEIGRKSTVAALRRIPGRVLIDINKRAGYRLVTKAGEKGVVNLTKLVPLVGAPIGATVDGVSCRSIAGYALRIFEARMAVSAATDTSDVIDAEVVD